MALTLGIDIGQRSIRGAVLRTSLRTQEVERYLEVPVPSLAPESEARAGVVRTAVQELLAQLGSAPDAIVAALDGTHASLRAVEIPAVAKKRAHDVLPFELEALLPFPMEEAMVDYQEIAPNGDKLKLLAVAVPELVVGETLKELADAGISPRELAVGAAALDGLATYLAQPPGEAWLLVHLDDELTDMAVLRDGVCELGRTLDEGLSSLEGRPQSLRFALQQTLMKYRADGGPLPAKLVVMGMGTERAEVVAWLGEALSLPVEAVALPAPRGAAGPVSPVFGRALALATRVQRRGKRFDLRRGPFALPRGMSQLRDYALLATGCALVLVFSYVFSVWAEYRVLAEERDALQKKLGDITEERLGERAESPKLAKALLEGGGTRKDPLPRFDAFRALAAISDSVPESIKHDTRELEIELDETGLTGKIHLEGSLADLAARDQVADAIEAHECIEELERGKTSTIPGEERKRYVLDATIACPGAVPKKGSQAARPAKK